MLTFHQFCQIYEGSGGIKLIEINISVQECHVQRQNNNVWCLSYVPRLFKMRFAVDAGMFFIYLFTDLRQNPQVSWVFGCIFCTYFFWCSRVQMHSSCTSVWPFCSTAGGRIAKDVNYSLSCQLFCWDSQTNLSTPPQRYHIPSPSGTGLFVFVWKYAFSYIIKLLSKSNFHPRGLHSTFCFFSPSVRW